MTITAEPTAAGQLRRILERESETRLAWKRARAEVFVGLIRSGTGVNLAWQTLTADPALRSLEDEYEAARIDLVVENAINWGKLGDSAGEPAMKVPCEVEATTLEGDYVDDIDGALARCLRCGAETEVYGTSENSVKAALMMLREECPRDEHNFYFAESNDLE